MKRLICEMIFLSCLYGGAYLWGRHQYKKGWKDNDTISEILSDIKNDTERSKDEKES